ncbi:NSFL1 cofactor p47 [Zeugodacus cucurbitae]|uniref:NSFL1 cofactor p47 n=1 Tax=Zeugodacus cucurbitae TaxID=28588 RepID=A0A0A1XHA1_ZEUCU|nr:NSFL1 cofactor p47 [Zeugodacus cucurbitae]
MSNNDELIAQFIEISGGDENVARFYLASSNWSLEDALSNFLGNQVDGEGGTEEHETERNSGGANVEPAPTNSTGRVRSETGVAESFTKKSSDKPKVATLNDMTKRTSNEEEGQAFYAGGSERSGQQVLGPPKRKNFREQLTDMFRMAQEHNTGESASTSAGPSTSGAVQWGQGVRLGMTDTDHSVVATQQDDANATGEKRPIVVLKLWSQGFSIDDGELRLYDDPENKEFLETVMRGEIPHELFEMGWVVNVDVEDHRHEDYKRKTVPPKFKGSGHTLGSPTPNVEGAGVAAATVPAPNSAKQTTAVNVKEDENAAKDKLKVDSSQPTTTLQIRLADGSRLTAQFNLNHTVADIRRYIMNARPQYAEGNFRLVSSFPTRELTDEAATIELAGLKNASILQRLN